MNSPSTGLARPHPIAGSPGDDADMPPDVARDLFLLEGTNGRHTTRQEPPRAFLLTGATGFVGVHTLAALLQRPDAEVTCLVRPGQEGDGPARLRSALARYGLDAAALDERVQVVAGDLAAPRCGLSAPDWQRLRASTDAIIHNGAVLNFLRPYARMRATNVGSTRWLLLLAAEAGCGLSYVSSIMSVVPRESVDRPFPARLLEADPPPPFATLESGYVRTKWVAERLVERAAAAGVTANILRVGVVVGPPGSSEAPDDQAQQRFATASLACGLLPTPGGAVDLVPVDFVGAAIAALARQRATGVFHLSNPAPLRGEDLAAMIAAHRLPLTVVPFRTWLAAVRAAATADPVHPLRPLLTQDGLAAGLRELEYALPAFDCRAAGAALTAASVDAPAPAANLLARLLGAQV